jgi:hypothetical protein
MVICLSRQVLTFGARASYVTAQDQSQLTSIDLALQKKATHITVFIYRPRAVTRPNTA